MAKVSTYLFLLLSISFVLSAIVDEVDVSSPDASKAFEAKFKSGLFSNLKDDANDSFDMCERRINPSEPNYFYFFPNFKAKLFKEGDVMTFKAGCFQNNTVTLTKLTQKETIITLHSEKPKNLFCSDVYDVHTANINHLTSVFFKGDHKIKLKNLSTDDMDEIKVNGIKLLGFCSGMIETMKSLFMTLGAFVGGLGYDPHAKIPIFRPHIPEYMVKHNLAMLQFYNHWQPLPRNDTVVDIDENEINTGDFVAVSRLDGIDPMIMMGIGSTIGHSAVCAWIDGKLYVLESQDGFYWPYHGVQKTPFKEWVQLAHNAEFNVAILPMREDIRAKFDTEKAVSWFLNGIEGLPYGYHNFLFGWIDTVDSNMPFAITHGHFEFLFTVLEKISKDTATLMMGEAFNMRIGTRNLTLAQATAEAARQGYTFEEVVAMPEGDDWEYSNGKNYVCACFVARFYKAGGLFDGYDILANEFTPKDVVQLDFFDKDYKDKRPQACKDADPDLPYCQIMGKWQVPIFGYSTIPLYDHMNEKCPSLAPDFYRPSDC